MDRRRILTWVFGAGGVFGGYLLAGGELSDIRGAAADAVDEKTIEEADEIETYSGGTGTTVSETTLYDNGLAKVQAGDGGDGVKLALGNANVSAESGGFARWNLPPNGQQTVDLKKPIEANGPWDSREFELSTYAPDGYVIGRPLRITVPVGWIE